jgi:hypothetical protein
METKNKVAAVLAAAVGLALQGCAAAPVVSEQNGNIMQTSPQMGNQILCYGANQCRGYSQCMLTTTSCRYVNACAGKNSCRGKGGTYMTMDECKAKGGTIPLVPAPNPNL